MSCVGSKYSLVDENYHFVAQYLWLLCLHTKGLQLRVKGHKQAFISYSYALTPFMESRVKVDWKILTAEGVECQHIQFHQLQKGEDLNSLVLKYKKSHAVAIILVNIDDTYNLASQFTEEFVKTKKGNFPVVLVTGENGQSLKEFLNHHDPGELSARIMAKNMPQVELPSQQLAGGSYSPTLPSKSLPRQGLCYGWYAIQDIVNT